MDDGSGGGRSRRYEAGGETNAAPVGLTLGGILSIKQTPPYRIQDRTLLDLIRDDPTCGKDSKKTWKTLRDKLRLKLAGSAWTSAVSSDVRIDTNSNRITTQNGSNTTDESTLQLTSPPGQTISLQTALHEEDNEPTSTEEGRSAGREGGDAPALRMSLMSLLEFDGSAYLDDEEEEAAVVVEEAEDGGGGSGGGGGYNNCCVCMVRHKGAAFIPCGHTFCRLCSRELFVQRANCPLCNNFILEILDIF